jgi:hypothetical protein
MPGKTRRMYFVLGITAGVAMLGGLAAWAASKAVDLDNNGVAESTVALNILSTSPARIENVVTNKAVGYSYTFSWYNSGPGGFKGTLGVGTATGVGTKWTWQTSQAIYSITGNSCGTSPNDICFTQTAGPTTVGSRGPFAVPGRSLTTSGVTLSSASLTSSLISFFSPPKVLFTATSSVGQPGSGQVSYDTLLGNNTGGAVTAVVDAGPPGCCPNPDQLNCSGTCVNYLTDASNCGGCGVQCDTFHGQFCDSGTCRSNCPLGQVQCGTDCVDTTTDPLNCGGCGHACGTNQICSNSTCITCTSPQQTACDNQCVNIHTDPTNCGGCGVNCNLQCPSTGQGACSQGNSCFCIGAAAGSSSSIAETAVLVTQPLATLPPPAPVCETQASTTAVPPGGSVSLGCNTAGYLAKEVLTFVRICLDGSTPNPVTGLCADLSSPSVGPFMRLAPDTSRPVGAVNVALNSTGVTVVDPSLDGLIQPGEAPIKLNFSIVNSGTARITGACATLSSPAQDITPGDGISNPTTVNILTGTACYPDIPGTAATGNTCALAPPINPVSGLTPFSISIPAGYIGDTSRVFLLHFTGSADGTPISEDVPVTVGIASACNPADIQNGFDGLVGLYSPMAAFLTDDDPRSLPFPPKPFALGKTRPLKLTFSCGGLNLDASNALPPKIVGLFNLTTNTPVDITKVNINDSPNMFDPQFRYETSLGGWIYQMRTKDLAKARYKLTVLIDGRKSYVTGFELN